MSVHEGTRKTLSLRGGGVVQVGQLFCLQKKSSRRGGLGRSDHPNFCPQPRLRSLPLHLPRQHQFIVNMFKPSNPMMARLRLTTKQVGGGYYKGNRVGSMGHFDHKGNYVIDWKKVRTYVVPEDLDSFKVCLLES